MSIIQDALKKAQGEYVEKKLPPVKERETIHTRVELKVSQETKDQARETRLPALITIFIMVLLSYGFILSIQYIRTPSKVKIQRVTPDKKEAVTPYVKKENNPKPVNFLEQSKLISASLIPSMQPAFVLSGIMYLENKPQAIINGHVLEEGDKINGATILIIEKDSVLLDLNDTNIKVELSK